jgi:Uncharacterized protein conserved in bacteria (DUF2125)
MERTFAPALSPVNGHVYIAAMRRSKILAITGAGLVVIGFGTYSAFWWFAAGKIKEEAATWAAKAHEQEADVSWKALRVAGYPFAFHVELTDLALRRDAPGKASEFRAPIFSVSVVPWNLRAADFAAPQGFTATLGPDSAPLAKLSADKLSGAAAAGRDGQRTVWLSLLGAKGTAGDEISARVVYGWIIWPRNPPAAHGELGLAVAALVRDTGVPAAPPGFTNPIEEISLGLTAMGPIPSGPPRQAATAWRDSGGTLELDHINLRWGNVTVNGNGTFALDGELQPTGALSGGIAGYDQLMNALVAAGRVKEKDARVGRLALSLLAHPGKDGRAEIAAQLTIQDGEMRLGPIKLPAPRINW